MRSVAAFHSLTLPCGSTPKMGALARSTSWRSSAPTASASRWCRCCSLTSVSTPVQRTLDSPFFSGTAWACRVLTLPLTMMRPVQSHLDMDSRDCATEAPKAALSSGWSAIIIGVSATVRRLGVSKWSWLVQELSCSSAIITSGLTSKSASQPALA